MPLVTTIARWAYHRPWVNGMNRSSDRPTGDTITLFLCGDVMPGRGIDQILPHPGDPRLHEAMLSLNLWEFQGGAFIAFHGSWNRSPEPQQGYNVVFQPMSNGKAMGDFQVFADGFAGPRKEPGLAVHRPSGLAVGPDGALFVTDDQRGTVWRVTYKQ
jgi:hypothetical protein